MKTNTNSPPQYKVILSKDAVSDIQDYKSYILTSFGYREYAENFSRNIKHAIKSLHSLPHRYIKTPYSIEGLHVFYKPYDTYLIFFVIKDRSVTVIRVLKDRMHWQNIISKMRKIN